MKALCALKGISKDFLLPHGQILHVLEKIELSIYPKEVVAVIGPSGCGKSTLLRILAGLELPTKGNVICEGKVQRGLLDFSSIVFQSFALYPWMTVKENVEVVLKAIHAPTQEIDRRSQEILELVGLSGFEQAYPKEISGGMKQRVGLARALVQDPKLLLMDEPFSAVDAFTAEGLRSEVLRIWKEKERNLSSIFLISHDIQEVVSMADRIVLLKPNPGRVHQIIENKISRPRDPRSKEFLDLVDLLHSMYFTEPKKLSERFIQECSSLLAVSHDEILGLLSYIQRDSIIHDLPKIALETHQHFERVLMVAEAAEFLHFVEISHQKVLLTDIGKAYLNSTEKSRRILWKRQLLTIPLFIKVCDWISKAPHQLLDKKILYELISKELPYEDAMPQIKVLIRWGHYGNLFTYHPKNQKISMK